MLKVLLKKQLMELYRSFFYDQKKGKAKSKSSTAVSIVLYALLMIVVLGGIFTALALSLCAPLAEAGMSWLYFAITGLIAIVLGVFGSVFSTFSGMYLAKDNDQLLSMPIPVRYILYSRLLGVYLMGLMFSGVVLLPALIVYGVMQPFTLKFLFGAIMLIVLVTVFVLVLSCILGWVVAKISAKLKNKSVITVFVALAFFAVYYYVYFKAGAAIGQLIANVDTVAEKLRGAYPLYLLGRVGEGDLLSILILTVIIAAACVIVLYVLSRSFLSIVSANTSGSKNKKTEHVAQKKSEASAMRAREFKRFTSSANYMLNCGLGTLFLFALAVLVALKGGVIGEALSGMMGAQMLPVIICVIVIFAASMNDTTAASVSLEGKTIWIVRSLPVDTWQVLRAKLDVQILITAIPALLVVVCSVFAFHISALMAVLMILFTVIYTFAAACFGLLLNLKKPNVTWTNEIVPIKQSVSVLFSMLGSWAFGLVFIGAYLLLRVFQISSEVYVAAFFVIAAIVTLLLYRWLKKQGVARFEAL